MVRDTAGDGNLRNAGWDKTTLFVVSLIPLSINGIGANYAFVLLPLFALVVSKRAVLPNYAIVIYLCGCAIVFALASIYQLEWIAHYDRRILSFVSFVAMFAMCFYRLEYSDIRSFKVAILVAAIYFSLESLITYLWMGGAALHFEAKDIVGGQRYGFVYLLAFWILLHDSILDKIQLLKYALLLLLLAGLALTFSRASIVAFAFSCLIGAFHGICTTRQSPVKIMRLGTSALLFMLASAYVITQFFPIISDFFWVRLIEFTVSKEGTENLTDSATSEGTRILIWANIIEHALRNPLTGAGFLGPWVLDLFGDGSGSSHSQYFDTLFRVGPILFLGYLYFLYEMLKYYRKNDPGIFIGLAGVLVYGLFHETFKESHGAFLYSMLLAICMQRPRVRRRL